MLRPSEDLDEWWRVGNRLGRVGGRQKESAKKVVGLPAYVADRCRNSVIGSRSQRYSVIGARISASTDQISLEAVVGDQISAGVKADFRFADSEPTRRRA
jgi:hypothetical protein